MRPRACQRLIGPKQESLSLTSRLDANPEVRFAHKLNARPLERASNFLDRIEVGFNPVFKPLEPANCHDCHTGLESKSILPPAEKRSRCLDLPHINKHSRSNVLVRVHRHRFFQKEEEHHWKSPMYLANFGA
jgi:hypothetical protein